MVAVVQSFLVKLTTGRWIAANTATQLYIFLQNGSLVLNGTVNESNKQQIAKLMKWKKSERPVKS